MIPKIVISVKGGLIQKITSNTEVHIMILDWDNIYEGDKVPDDFDYSIEISDKIYPHFEPKKPFDKEEVQLYENLKKLNV